MQSCLEGFVHFFVSNLQGSSLLLARMLEELGMSVFYMNYPHRMCLIAGAAPWKDCRDVPSSICVRRLRCDSQHSWDHSGIGRGFQFFRVHPARN